MYGKSGTGFASTERHDPIRAFNYEVVFTGKVSQHRTGFMQVGGIKVQSDFKEYKEGGNNGIADQIPMDTKFEPIEMSGGMTQGFDLANAFAGQFSNAGNGHEKTTWTIDIKLLDRDGETVLRTTQLTDAWISRYEEGDYDAMNSSVKIEKIVVQFQGASVK